MSFMRPYTDWADDREGVAQTLARAGLTGPVPHPDYRSAASTVPGGERCVCGGIRYYHATKKGGGCDDCLCPEFLAALGEQER